MTLGNLPRPRMKQIFQHIRVMETSTNRQYYRTWDIPITLQQSKHAPLVSDCSSSIKTFFENKSYIGELQIGRRRQTCGETGGGFLCLALTCLTTGPIYFEIMFPFFKKPFRLASNFIGRRQHFQKLPFHRTPLST